MQAHLSASHAQLDCDNTDISFDINQRAVSDQMELAARAGDFYCTRYQAETYYMLRKLKLKSRDLASSKADLSLLFSAYPLPVVKTSIYLLIAH